MLLREELAMKRSLVVLAFFLTLSPGFVAEDKQAELKLSEVGLQLFLAPPVGKRGPERMSLVLTNASARGGLFRLPSAFVADDRSTSSFAPFPPWLGLLVKDPKSGREEQFVLTTFARLRSPAKLVSLPKGQPRELEYRLASFYRWGPGNPDRYGSFKDYFKPGEVELEIRAVIFVEGVEDRVLSNPQRLRCSFPEGLFKDTSKDNGTARKSDGNPGTASKPESKP
jgi:hypothetical protein